MMRLIIIAIVVLLSGCVPKEIDLGITQIRPHVLVSPDFDYGYRGCARGPTAGHAHALKNDRDTVVGVAEGYAGITTRLGGRIAEARHLEKITDRQRFRGRRPSQRTVCWKLDGEVRGSYP